MKNLLLAAVFLFISAQSSAQVFGLMANHFTVWHNGQEKTVKKNIYIIYSPDFCKLFIQGEGTYTFTTHSYQRSMIGKYLHTDFYNNETNVLNYNQYNIMVDENPKQIMFQVVTQSDYTYEVDNAKKFNTDGEIKGIK